MMEEIPCLHFALDNGSDPTPKGRCSLAVDAGIVWDGSCQPLEVWLQVGVLAVEVLDEVGVGQGGADSLQGGGETDISQGQLICVDKVYGNAIL